MGEPTFNYKEVFRFTRELLNDKAWLQARLNLRIETLHPVFTTMCPKGVDLEKIIIIWTLIKNNDFNGQAGLQLSINSTDETQRKVMFKNMAISLEELSKICSKLPKSLGRKYCLNFALADDYIVDAVKLRQLFDVDNFMVKITPIHNNNACRKNNIKTELGYTEYTPYKKVEEELIKAGFDVLIFVHSFDEENGCVTCGNALLAGSKLNLI